MRDEPEILPARVRDRESPTLMPRAARILALFGIAPRTDDPRLHALRAATLDSDDLADACVRSMDALPAGAGRRMFEQALEQGIESVRDATPELRALFAQVDAVPAWLDRSLVMEGADAYVRQGPEGLCALSAVSLMGGYLSSCATKPLAQTGALLSMAPRRLAETTHFVHAVTTSGALLRDSEGFKTIVRVRLMHALVRQKLSASPGWREMEWGVPINQRDMVATHLSFTLLFVLGATMLGRLVSAREREGIIHLFRYVSYLLGTPDALLPKTFREAAEIGALINISEPGPDHDGRALAQALVSTWRSRGPFGGGPRAAELFGSFMVGYARYALGNEAADRLGLPDTSWKHVVPIVATMRLAQELAGRVFPARRQREAESARRLVDDHLTRTLNGAPARYMPHAVSA